MQNTTSTDLITLQGPIAVSRLSDLELEERLKRLTGIERKALAMIIDHLAEFDKRRLHVERGYPSLFAYCVDMLGYSEQAAYKRIQAARAALVFPEISEKISNGSLTLTAVVILAPHLHSGNGRELIAAAEGRRTREIEVLAAELAPRPDIPDYLKQLSAERHLFRFTAGSAFRNAFERTKRLRGVGRQSMEEVFEAGLNLWLDRADPERRISRRNGQSSHIDGERPRRRSRKVRLALRDHIWARDGGRCAYLPDTGERCPATSNLEVDHVRPYALGGASNDPDNLRLMCRAHNQLLARRVFGAAADKRSRIAPEQLSLRIVDAAES